MATSPEYPDLSWMPPKSWTDANRSKVQLVVIHTTEGSAQSQSAEDGAAYDQRRTDGTSTHYFHDSNSTVQCVRTEDQAHAARTQGNKRGIQHELCTKAGSANWSDSYHQAMLRIAAKQAARDAEKWGIPVKKLSSSQVADGVKGFCGHVDITYAFPEDNGTHTDPGSNFPWSQFLGMVQEEMEGSVPLNDDDVKKIWNYGMDNPYTPDTSTTSAGGFLRFAPSLSGIQNGVVAVLKPYFDQLGVQISGVDTDEAAIVQGVLAGLAGADGAAETIADAVVAALPPDLAAQVVDEIAKRLTPA